MASFAMATKKVLLLVLLVIGLPVHGAAQTSQEVNESNNPSAPKLGMNLQDQYISSYFGLPDSESNAILLRGVLPHKLFGWPQILRATVPIVTSPDTPVGETTGPGGHQRVRPVAVQGRAVGAGLRTTTDDRFGHRRPAGDGQVAGRGRRCGDISPQRWGLLGGLVTFQHSFAGGDDRPTQNTLRSQPFVIYNLPQGFYLRSTATWNFDLQRGDFYIPLGVGVGKGWKTVDASTLNLFVEPQWTVAHEGVAPKLQVFFGLNMQFPLRR